MDSFIFIPTDDINFNPGPSTQKEMICYGNFYLSTTLVLPDIINDVWNIIQKINMHFIYLNESILLSKVDEIHYIAKLTDDTITGSAELNLATQFWAMNWQDLTDLQEEDLWLVLLKTLFHIIGNLIFALIQRVFL